MVKFLTMLGAPLFLVGWPLGLLFRPLSTGFNSGYFYVDDLNTKAWLKKSGFSDKEIEEFFKRQDVGLSGLDGLDGPSDEELEAIENEKEG